MDDGDILKPRTTNEVDEDVSKSDQPDPSVKPNHLLIENRAGDFESLSDYNKNRFSLWSRTNVPTDLVRSKLSDVVDIDLIGEKAEEECIQVLQVLAKNFIAETVEGIRTRNFPSKDPIEPSEFIESRFKRPRYI